LSAHVLHWRHYLEHLALDGHYLSDRYFVMELIASSHDSVRLFLERYVGNLCEDRTMINQPLPRTHAPGQITAFLLSTAKYYRRDRLIVQTPREMRSLSAPLHALDMCLDVAAVTESGVCFFCKKSGHVVADCPLILEMREDKFASRAIAGALGVLPPRSNSSRPRGSGGAARIRQLEAEEGVDVPHGDDSVSVASSGALDDAAADDAANVPDDERDGPDFG
jgi:hypothetical protein